MKIAFMYPGQGAQKNGMMQDFYEQSLGIDSVVETPVGWCCYCNSAAEYRSAF